MNRFGVAFISTIFAGFAIIVCFYSFFISSETAVKTQAIYWFCAALVSAIIPYIKEAAVYIDSVKFGNLEIALNEVKQELQRVDNKVERLDNKLLMTLGQVRQNEALLSKEARNERQKIYDESAEVLALLPPEKKLKLQERFTLSHLKDAKMEISQLKEILRQLGYYQGAIDQQFTLELVQSVERLQTELMDGQADGIVGPMTLAKIAECLES